MNTTTVLTTNELTDTYYKPKDNYYVYHTECRDGKVLTWYKGCLLIDESITTTKK